VFKLSIENIDTIIVLRFSIIISCFEFYSISHNIVYYSIVNKIIMVFFFFLGGIKKKKKKKTH